MKKSIMSGTELKEMFENYNRDYFSYEACDALLEFYDEIDENMEVDIVAICCGWTEYGFEDDALLQDYGYLCEDDFDDEMDEEEKVRMLIDELENRTTIIELEDSVLVMEF